MSGLLKMMLRILWIKQPWALMPRLMGWGWGKLLFVTGLINQQLWNLNTPGVYCVHHSVRCSLCLCILYHSYVNTDLAKHWLTDVLPSSHLGLLCVHSPPPSVLEVPGLPISNPSTHLTVEWGRPLPILGRKCNAWRTQASPNQPAPSCCL